MHRFLLICILSLVSLTSWASDVVFMEKVPKYITLDNPLPVTAPPNKVEVREFFFYGCLHCYHLNQALRGWKVPDSVYWVRTPVAFQKSSALFSQIYFVTEDLKLSDAIHNKVFDFVQDHDIRNEDELQKLLLFIRINKDEFSQRARSFSMNARLNQSDILIRQAKLKGTPSIVVDGRFMISGLSPQETLIEVSRLVSKIREEKHMEPSKATLVNKKKKIHN